MSLQYLLKWKQLIRITNLKRKIMDALLAEDQDPILQMGTFSTCPCNQNYWCTMHSHSPVRNKTQRSMKQSTSKTKNTRGNAVKSTQSTEKNLLHTYTIDRKVNGWILWRRWALPSHKIPLERESLETNYQRSLLFICWNIILQIGESKTRPASLKFLVHKKLDFSNGDFPWI